MFKTPYTLIATLMLLSGTALPAQVKIINKSSYNLNLFNTDSEDMVSWEMPEVISPSETVVGEASFQEGYLSNSGSATSHYTVGNEKFPSVRITTNDSKYVLLCAYESDKVQVVGTSGDGMCKILYQTPNRSSTAILGDRK